MAKQRKRKERNGVAEFEEKIGREANLFELSVIGIMSSDIYGAIRERLGLVLHYIESGRNDSAIDILDKFLGSSTERK